MRKPNYKDFDWLKAQCGWFDTARNLVECNQRVKWMADGYLDFHLNMRRQTPTREQMGKEKALYKEFVEYLGVPPVVSVSIREEPYKGEEVMSYTVYIQGEWFLSGQGHNLHTTLKNVRADVKKAKEHARKMMEQDG